MKVTTLILLSALAGVATAARLRSQQRLGEHLGDTGPEAPPSEAASTSKATTASIAAANAANDARTATEEASETSEVSIYRGMDMGVELSV